MQRILFGFILFLMVGIFSVQCSQKEDSLKVEVITISINYEDKIRVNDSHVLLDDLSDHLKSFDKKISVKIIPEHASTMGIIQEVHNRVLESGLTRIAYGVSEELATKKTE